MLYLLTFACAHDHGKSPVAYLRSITGKCLSKSMNEPCHDLALGLAPRILDQLQGILKLFSRSILEAKIEHVRVSCV